MKYKLAQNTIPNEDIDKLIEWLKTYPPLTMPAGTLVKKLEERWSRKTGAQYSVFCNSGSSANLLAYAALLNKYPELKIGMTYLSAAGWATTLAPIFQLGMVPILCEVDSKTFGIDTNYLENELQKNGKYKSLVVLVHTLGVPNNIDRILELKEKYNFILMEDNCPSVGSMYKEKFLGTFGDISTFSFYYGHQLSTIEGGMICTNDKVLYDMLLMLRSHGWSKDIDQSRRADLEEIYNIDEHHSAFTFYMAGFNLRPTEINAFLGLQQIEKLHNVALRRNCRFWQYYFRLKDKFIVQQPLDYSLISCITFPFITSGKEETEKVFKLLKDNEIETRPISGGSLGLQPVWKRHWGSYTHFKFADNLHYNGFVLPCHPEISSQEIDSICDLLLSV